MKIKNFDQFIKTVDESGLRTAFTNIAIRHGVRLRDVYDGPRSKTIAATRQEIWHMLRSDYGWSYPDVARLFDNHHTTVISAIKDLAQKPEVKTDLYDRILKVLELQCSSYCMDNEEERQKVAALLTEELSA